MGQEFSLDIFRNHLPTEKALQEVLACNDFSRQYGLILTKDNIQELAECRSAALKSTGRIEFGGGILPKLIHAFCDSPFIDRENYVQTLAMLQEAFYYYKSEANERLSDDALIGYMKKVFNGRAQGSVEYLTGTSLEALCRYARNGCDPANSGKAGDLF